MKQLGAVQHLLIDLDGTLLESRDLPLRLDFTGQALRAFRQHGGWLRAIRALRAVRVELEGPVTAGGPTNQARAGAAFARALGLPVADGERLLHETINGLFPSLKRHFYPVPGAREFLEWARGHYELTLATNPVWPLEAVLQRLEWAGIDPAVFKRITHAGSMHACKPSAEYYREVIGSRAPSEFLLLGDDVRKDLPATRVGIATYILSRRSRYHPEQGNTARSWTGDYGQLRALLDPRNREAIHE